MYSCQRITTYCDHSHLCVVCTCVHSVQSVQSVQSVIVLVCTAVKRMSHATDIYYTNTIQSKDLVRCVCFVEMFVHHSLGQGPRRAPKALCNKYGNFSFILMSCNILELIRSVDCRFDPRICVLCNITIFSFFLRVGFALPPCLTSSRSTWSEIYIGILSHRNIKIPTQDKF